MKPPAREPNCVFCRVAAGELPSTKVMETEGVLAFEDLNPGAPHHVLVVPKAHVASIADLAVEQPEGARIWAELLSVVQRIAASRPDLANGWRLVSNVGENGGQSVLHLHLHVLGGRRMTWPPG